MHLFALGVFKVDSWFESEEKKYFFIIENYSICI